MASSRPSASSLRRGWRGAQAGPASRASRWIARAALTLAALGLAAVFLYFVSRSRQPTRTYLFEQVAEYDQTREDVPPGSFFFAADDERYFEQRQSGVVFIDQKFGDAIAAPALERPLIVCLAGQALAPAGGRCVMLDPVSGAPLDLSQLISNLAAQRSPLKLLALELGTLAADPGRGVSLNQAALQVDQIVRATNDPTLWVLLSHGTGQVSWLPPLRRRSPYCESVALALRGRADLPAQGGNEDQRVDLPELASFVTSRTWAWSRVHAPAAQTPVLLRGGQGAVDVARLMNDVALRAITLALVLPEAEKPSAAAPAPQHSSAGKTSQLAPMRGTLTLWQPAPPSAGATKQPPPATSPMPAAAEAPGAPTAEPPKPTPPPQTIEEYFAALWLLRDQLDAAPTLGDSPLDYGPQAWQLFQTSLADRELRYRMGRLKDALLLPELQRCYADLTELAGKDAAAGGASSRPAGDDRVGEALALLRSARRDHAAAWNEYRDQSASPGDFAPALRRLQRALLRLPSLRAIAATKLTVDSQLCRRISSLQAATAQAIAVLDVDQLNAAGVARFVQAVAALDDEQLVAEQVSEALAGPLMASETLLATPLPSSTARLQLLAEAAKRSDPKLHAELARSQAPAALLDPSAAQWSPFQPWHDLIETSARLLAIGTASTAPAANATPLSWQAWATLDADLAASYRRLDAAYQSGGAPGARLRYWQAFLLAPREFRAARGAVEHGVPPWPRFNAGPIDLAILCPDAVVLPPRFGATAKQQEFPVTIRCSGPMPRSLAVTLAYPADLLELTWQGPRGDAERQAVSNGESYSLEPAENLVLKFWARARRDQLAGQPDLRITARAVSDEQTVSPVQSVPIRLGLPEVQVVAQGQQPPQSLEPLVLDCFPGQNVIPLSIVNQTSRPLAQLTVKLVARDPAAPSAAVTLAEGSIAELATGAEPLAVSLLAPPPADPAASGQPGLMELAGREIVCEVWEPAPAPPAGEEPPPPPAPPTLILSRELTFNALRPWDYLQPTFTWANDDRELQVRFVPHSGRLPAAGSTVHWNSDASTLEPEPGQLDEVVRIDDRGSLAAPVPRDVPDEPEQWRIVFDVDGYARGLVYDVPADPGLGARSLNRPEIRLLPRLLPPSGATPEQEQAFHAKWAWAIDPTARRIVIRPDQRLQVTAEVDVPTATFVAQQRDAISVGFDASGNGRLDSLEAQATFRDARDTRLFWEGVDAETGALRIVARSSDWSTELARLPEKPRRPVTLLGEVRRQGAEEPAQDTWQVLIDHQPPQVSDVQPVTVRQGNPATISVTVEDPEPASGVATVQVALWRAGLREPKWIEAQPEEGNATRWTAPLDTKELQPRDAYYDVLVRAVDRVDNEADRPHPEPRAVHVLLPLPPEEMQKSKANKVLVSITLRGQLPKSGEVSLLKEGKPWLKQPLDDKGQCVFEEVDAGVYEVQATGKTSGGARYDLDAPLSVTVKDLPAPPAKVTGNLNKYVM